MFRQIKETIRFVQIKTLYSKYERFLIPGFLLSGFISDLIFFSFISFDFAIFALSVHLMIVALGITFINLYEDGTLRGNFFNYLRLFIPLALQFSFGALFSSFVIFYSFSGSIFASWPFLAILVFLMVANEIFKRYNTRADVQISVFFFALFSFFNLSIPYLIRDLGPEVFFASGNMALLITGFFIWALFKYSPRVLRSKKLIISSIGAIFLTMNIFYFTNLIPPIPLAMRDAGVYYAIQKIGEEYKLIDREVGFFEGIINTISFKNVFKIYDMTNAYVWSAVFAPPGMNIEILHEWQFHDPKLGWVTRNKIPFPITGGRKEGFRGFSTAAIEPGKWRINIKTKNNQTIGRFTFIAEKTNTPPEYIIEIK